MPHSALEREIEKRGQELMRMFWQKHLEAGSPGKCQSATADRGHRSG
jgi:hypothetical protein